MGQNKKDTKSNILKCRDDRNPTFFEMDENYELKLVSENQPDWLDRKEEIGPENLRSRIEPWLTSLFQSDHLALLTGTGLSNAVHQISTGSVPNTMSNAHFNVFKDQIEKKAPKVAEDAGRGYGNIEDQFRVANELLKGLEHYCSIDGFDELRKQKDQLNRDLEIALINFSKSILNTEYNIATSSGEKRQNAYGYLVNFLMSFASRTGTRDRLQIFTTNYDRVIESGAEIAGLHLIDRFIGNLTPVFRSSRLNIDMHYDPPGIRGEPRYLEGVARFTKLHGSIDWIHADNEIRKLGIPFGAKAIKPFLKAPGFNNVTSGDLMIYPNAAKDKETVDYPYVELFRDFAASICRPNSTLVTYGYSFGDDHINRVIKDMLSIPSTHLVIISFDDPLDRIMNFYNDLGKSSQVTLLIGNHFGYLPSLVDYYLPKPAIDRITSRMTELLKARYGNDQPDEGNVKNNNPEGKTDQ